MTNTTTPGTEAGFDLDKLNSDVARVADWLETASPAVKIAFARIDALARQVAPDTTGSASGETNCTDGGKCGIGGYCKDCPYVAQPVQAGEAVELVQRMRAAFHVNMLRTFPNKTHAEIEAEIDKACGIERASFAPVSAKPSTAIGEHTVLAELPDIFAKLREAYRRGAHEQGSDAGEYRAAEDLMRAWDLPDAPVSAQQAQVPAFTFNAEKGMVPLVSAQQGAARQDAVECDSALRAEPAVSRYSRLAALANKIAVMHHTHGRGNFGKQADFDHYLEGFEEARNEAAQQVLEFATRCRAEGGNTNDNNRSDLAAKAPAAQADDQLQRMRAAFHVNMMRAYPDKSHAEIAAEIDKACGPASAPEAMTEQPLVNRLREKVVRGTHPDFKADILAAADLIEAAHAQQPAAPAEVTKAELWDAIHQYVSDYGDQFRVPPTTGAGKRCNASRDELAAVIDKLYAAPAITGAATTDRHKEQFDVHFGEGMFDACAAASLEPNAATTSNDAQIGKWLIEQGFKHANVDLTSNGDGEPIVIFEPRFYIPEPVGMSYDDAEWTVDDIRAAIGAAMSAHQAKKDQTNG